MLPRTVDGMKHVCYFRHALALDERRVKFLPEYAYGGTTEPPRTSLDIIQDRRLWENIVDYSKGMTEEPQTLEVWFAGTHSDMYVAHSSYIYICSCFRCSEEEAILRTPEWIVVGHLCDGWCTRPEPLAFAQPYSSMASHLRNKSTSKNL